MQRSNSRMWSRDTGVFRCKRQIQGHSKLERTPNSDKEKGRQGDTENDRGRSRRASPGLPLSLSPCLVCTERVPIPGCFPYVGSPPPPLPASEKPDLKVHLAVVSLDRECQNLTDAQPDAGGRRAPLRDSSSAIMS